MHTSACCFPRVLRPGREQHALELLSQQSPETYQLFTRISGLTHPADKSPMVCCFWTSIPGVPRCLLFQEGHQVILKYINMSVHLDQYPKTCPLWCTGAFYALSISLFPHPQTTPQSNGEPEQYILLATQQALEHRFRIKITSGYLSTLQKLWNITNTAVRIQALELMTASEYWLHH